jgi:hypothetical protein
LVQNFPSTNTKEENKNWSEVREIIENVDWDCEVVRLYRDRCFDVKESISSAINWFFENEENGIVLEDDCLPHPTFFRFCDELLEKYKDDQRISMISGDNFQFGYQLNDESYYFSNYSHVWGWASWRSRWLFDYDVEMKHWVTFKKEGRIKDWYCNHLDQKYFSDIFENVYQGVIHTWDYQWGFCNRLNGRVAVIPNVNLISNIGFGPEATNTTYINQLANIPARAMMFPLKHPTSFFASTSLDNLFHRRFERKKITQRIKSRIKKFLRNLVDY